MVQLGTVSVSSGSDTKVAPGPFLLSAQSFKDVGISKQFPNDGPQLQGIYKVVRSLEAEPSQEQIDSAGEYIFEWYPCSPEDGTPRLGYSKKGQKWKFLARIDALLNIDTPKPDDDEELEAPIDDTDELIGRQMKAMVEVVVNQAGNKRARIVAVYPYVPKKKPAKPAKVAPVNEDEDEDGEDEPLPF